MDRGSPGADGDLLHERPDERFCLRQVALHQELAHLSGVGGDALHVLHGGAAQREHGARLVRSMLQPLLILLMMPDAREYLLNREVRLLHQLPEPVRAATDVGKLGFGSVHALLLLPDDAVYLLVDHLHEVAHVGLSEDVLSDLIDDEALKSLRVEARRRALALTTLEQGVADVVGEPSSLRLGCGECLAAGLADEQSAEQVGAGGATRMRHLRRLRLQRPLHPPELMREDDGRESVLHAHRRSVVLRLRSPHQRSGVDFVAEHPVNGGLHPALPVGRGDAIGVEGFGDVENARATESSIEDAPDDGIGGWVQFEDRALLRAVLNVHLAVAVGRLRCDPEPARCRLPHTPHNLLGEILRVELVHRFDDRLHQFARGGIVCMLGDGDDPDALLAQHRLECHRVLPLACESGELPDEDDVERRMCAAPLVDHPAELWPVGDAPALGLVNVFTDDGVVVLLRVVAESAQLRSDGEVDVLPIGGNASVDGCGCGDVAFVHGRNPSVMMCCDTLRWGIVAVAVNRHLTLP